MPYKITVTPEVARLREGDSGSRNVTVARGTPERRVLTFNRVPVYLTTLPAEVAADPLLIVVKVTDEEMARGGGRLADSPAVESERTGETDDDGTGVEEDEDVEIVGESDQTIVEGDADPDRVNKSNTKPKRRKRR